jgi:putative DNA primase/helicase
MNTTTSLRRDAINAYLGLAASISSIFKRLFPSAPTWRPARCGNIKTLLLHLCDMDDQLAIWTLRWLAFQLRNPGVKMATALIVNGKHPGKSLFFEDVLVQLFGDGARVIVADQLHDRFTSWAAAPTSMVIAYGALEPRHAARLRAFITAESVIVERRGQAPQTRRNHLNFVLLCKSPEFIPDTGSRRFAIIETPPAWPRDFLDAVKAEIDQGGITDFREYLIRDLDIGKFNESTLPPLPAMRTERSAA